MGKTPRAGVVVLAAGRGRRFGAPTPKQFLTLGGRPVFMHSLAFFDTLEWVTQIVLVTPGDGLPEGCVGDLDALRRRPVCVAGGPRRQDSVAAGLAALATHASPFDVALVHDAARPFPDLCAVKRLAQAATHAGGGLLAARATDTVKRAAVADDDAPCVAETLDRATIWLAQTPQALRADLVARAVAEMRRPDLDVTDEASLLERWGVPVTLIESSARNLKITQPADLPVAEALLECKTFRMRNSECGITVVP